jgi:hypothetical protein
MSPFTSWTYLSESINCAYEVMEGREMASSVSGEANVFLRNHESVVGVADIKDLEPDKKEGQRRVRAFLAKAGEPLISALARVSALSGEVDVWRALGE